MHWILFALSIVAVGVAVALNIYDMLPGVGKNAMNTVVTFGTDNLSDVYCSTDSHIDVDELLQEYPTEPLNPYAQRYQQYL